MSLANGIAPCGAGFQPVLPRPPRGAGWKPALHEETPGVSAVPLRIAAARLGVGAVRLDVGAARLDVAAARLDVAAVRLANTRVLEAMRKDARLRGMGTTVVACLADDDTMSVAHVGDSRAYLVRDGKLSRITNDHSWVFEQVQAGMLTEEEAEKHPLRNVITRALGGALSVSPDASEIETHPGDVYLLCSDGLTGMVPEEEILRVVNEHHDDLPRACQELIDRANERGGLDNVTAILVKTV